MYEEILLLIKQKAVKKMYFFSYKKEFVEGEINFFLRKFLKKILKMKKSRKKYVRKPLILLGKIKKRKKIIFF